MERITKIGPLEIWGTPRKSGELADAIDNFKRAFRYAALRDAVKVRRLWRKLASRVRNS